jgi:putative Mg2+ transporter-C (MgtC) family protein
MHVSYEEGRGVMSRLLQACERRQWQLTDLASDTAELTTGPGQTGVLLTLLGRGIVNAPMVLAEIDGVIGIHQFDDDPD